ncbi:hypothetical protein L7F22_059945 [Adiantum nelumboides]|nr:hypothetical protein [Adiantum nelumboides]
MAASYCSSLSLLLAEILILAIIWSCCFTSASTARKAMVDVSAKCPNLLTTARLKSEPRDKSTILALAPWKVGYEQFVKFLPDSCLLDGFSIQVFLQALRHMQDPAPPRYKFVLHGSGNETPSYNGMIDMLANKEVDAVVADITITADRLEKVAFTVPYLASSLVMVTPFRYGSTGALWDFLEPFSRPLWLTLLGCFALTGVALYLLEDRNPDFAMTPKKRDGGSSEGGSAIQHQEMSTNVATTDSPSSPSHSTLSQSAPGHAPPPSLECLENPLVGDTSSLQRPGPPIYDQTSHKRRIMNAYWRISPTSRRDFDAARRSPLQKGKGRGLKVAIGARMVETEADREALRIDAETRRIEKEATIRKEESQAKCALIATLAIRPDSPHLKVDYKLTATIASLLE